ncbi:hypothetical protein LCGC14_1716010 [marine sediment metagenome]|uniref:Uncharacterized protein n=1 Tax=marine sediment metagenome TaxID=412755 RepID=A0A0F9HE55_9ZZZZ
MSLNDKALENKVMKSCQTCSYENVCCYQDGRYIQCRTIIIRVTKEGTK